MVAAPALIVHLIINLKSCKVNLISSLDPKEQTAAFIAYRHDVHGGKIEIICYFNVMYVKEVIKFGTCVTDIEMY